MSSKGQNSSENCRSSWRSSIAWGRQGLENCSFLGKERGWALNEPESSLYWDVPILENLASLNTLSLLKMVLLHFFQSNFWIIYGSLSLSICCLWKANILKLHKKRWAGHPKGNMYPQVWRKHLVIARHWTSRWITLGGQDSSKNSWPDRKRATVLCA